MALYFLYIYNSLSRPRAWHRGLTGIACHKSRIFASGPCATLLFYYKNDVLVWTIWLLHRLYQLWSTWTIQTSSLSRAYRFMQTIHCRLQPTLPLLSMSQPLFPNWIQTLPVAFQTVTKNMSTAATLRWRETVRNRYWDPLTRAMPSLIPPACRLALLLCCMSSLIVWPYEEATTVPTALLISTSAIETL